MQEQKLTGPAIRVGIYSTSWLCLKICGFYPVFHVFHAEKGFCIVNYRLEFHFRGPRNYRQKPASCCKFPHEQCSQETADSGLAMDALVSVCCWNTSGIMVSAWMLWSAYALGTRTELWFWHGCSGQRMLFEHERNYGFGMDALVSVCSRKNTILRRTQAEERNCSKTPRQNTRRGPTTICRSR